MADTSSRSTGANGVSGAGRNQMSTSRPIWWLRWPVGIGPPRGSAISPIRIPPPILSASAASLSMKLINCGCP